MDKCRELLKKHEGCRLKPYKCTAGKLTIGYGRNLDDVGITQAEADFLLSADIEKCQQKLTTDTDYYLAQDIVRRAVLVNMVFNLGWSGFNKFKKMIAAIRKRDYSEAAIQMMDSAWAEQVSNRAAELANMMESGEWQ